MVAKNDAHLALSPTALSSTLHHLDKFAFFACGHGLVALCHDFEPSAAENHLCRGNRGTLNQSRLKHRPERLVWKLGERLPDQVLCLSSDDGSKLRDSSPIADVQFRIHSLIIPFKTH
ncbi:hypothetical protein TNCV_4045581 [Trichonephila clavipes]|nr:hypothetical protein TNCV_4045581 [Trichonephila clavipes]